MVICLGHRAQQRGQLGEAMPGLWSDRPQGLEWSKAAGACGAATPHPGLTGPPPPNPVGSHVVNTNCSAAHTRQALCCKMSVEYDKFVESGRKCVVAEPLGSQGLTLAMGAETALAPRWFCHVDDDNYVNTEGLLQLLSAFSPSQDVYLGRPSLDHPIEAAERVQGGGTVSTGPGGGCLTRLRGTLQRLGKPGGPRGWGWGLQATRWQEPHPVRARELLLLGPGAAKEWLTSDTPVCRVGEEL